MLGGRDTHVGFPEGFSQEKGNFPYESRLILKSLTRGFKSVSKLNAKQRLVTMTNIVTSQNGENPKLKLFPDFS
jgi:hypothetical protein